MRFKAGIIRSSMAIAALCVSSATFANSFTYQFNLPDWQISIGPTSNALFGSHGILDITFENGSSTNLNQFYLNSQITQITLTSFGGTYSNTWTQADTWMSNLSPYNASNLSYVSTNAAGVPTLDLRSSFEENAQAFDNAGGHFQMARLNRFGNGYMPLIVSTNDPYNISFMLHREMSIVGTQTSGSVVSPVPEPSSLALAAIGLLGITFARKRRQA